MTSANFSTQNNPPLKVATETKPIQFRNLIFSYLRYWPLFIAATVIFLLAAYFYLKYTTPLYQSSIKILIKNDKNSGQLSEAAVFEDLGINAVEQNIENEIEIFKSTYLMAQVVKNLGLQYRVIKKGYVRDVDLYNDGPVNILEWTPYKQPFKPFKLLLNAEAGKNSYEAVYNNKVYKGRFGSALKLPQGILTLIRKNDFSSSAIKDIYLEVENIESVSGSLASKMSTAVVGKRSSIIQINIYDEHPERSRDILAELIKVYDINQVNDKNRILKNTINFLNDRLNIITQEVSNVDGNVERFKSSNQITDLSSEGAAIMQEANSYSKSITDIAIQEEILNGIQSTLQKNPKQFEFVPSNSGLTNLTLNNLLQTFNQLLLDREKVKTNLGPGHPNNAILEEQLSNLRSNIIENVVSMKRDLITSKNALRSREINLNSRLNSLPSQERQLIEIQRQQSIKQNLYLYLMQKREETALKLAIAVSNSRVVEPPKVGTKFKPQPNTIWVLALFSGILIPILVIGLIRFFSNTIKDEDDIKNNTSVPIIGSLGFDKEKKSMVVNDKTRSPISEMFRLIRANLQFVGEGVNNKVILLTSSASGEGKSFVCLNLGLTLALAGKKVLMMELDLRKPKFLNYLQLTDQNTKGITEYLVKESLIWNSVIAETSVHPGLFCTICGPIPPNPSELILSNRFAELIKNLREEFDYILIDTPPVGKVSDALLLNKFADSTLYVVRYNQTLKSQLNIIESISAEYKLPRPYIVFNGVKFNKRGYRYGYGYGYGYGYYEESTGK